MTWEMKPLKPTSRRNEATLTSFWGGTERCIQITQKIVDPWDENHSIGFVQLSRSQLMELVKRIDDWDSGAISEHDPYGEHAAERAELNILPSGT